MDVILKVSILIPAYNEEANIEYLLRSVLQQRIDGFSLERVIVVSDGSTDRTAEVVAAVDDPRIELRAFQERKGKVARLNEVFHEFSGDVLVQFDADVKLAHESVVVELVRPFREAPDTSLVCGTHEALAPVGFVEKLAHFGVRVWERAVASLGARGELYYCTGQVRAFSRSFVHTFSLPESVGSSEDFYSFYFAKAHGLRVVIARKARVLFRLPTTATEYIGQMTRFIQTAADMETYFGPELFKQYETMTNARRFSALFREAVRTAPPIVIGYVLLQLLPRLRARFTVSNPVWEGPASSKDLKE